jgi:hypothetical protein
MTGQEMDLPLKLQLIPEVGFVIIHVTQIAREAPL